MDTPLLLTELHAHSDWSDGTLSLSTLVDLYGEHRFDVLCVTDHTVRNGEGNRSFVGMHNWRDYLDAVDAEAERALARYGMVVVPGLELTDDHDDRLRSAHALAVGLRRFVSIDGGLRYAISEARGAGAAIIAAHPHAPGENRRGHVPLVARASRADDRRRPLRAVQPQRRLLVGRGRRAAGRRERRLPPARAPEHVEDAAPVRTGGARSRRVSAVVRAAVPRAVPARAPAAGAGRGR
jgi:hypothetical protein